MDDLEALKKISKELPRESKLERVKKYYLGNNNFALQDALPTSDILSLQESEKNEIKKLLLKKLKKGDWRAVEGLGDLRATEAKTDLIKALKSFKAKIDKYYKVSVALSLWKICKYEESESVILDILKNEKKCEVRAYAVFSLRYFTGDDCNTGIVTALDDKCESVRNNAVRTVLFKLGEKDNLRQVHEWEMQIDSQNQQIREKCFKNIIQALRDL